MVCEDALMGELPRELADEILEGVHSDLSGWSEALDLEIAFLVGHAQIRIALGSDEGSSIDVKGPLGRWLVRELWETRDWADSMREKLDRPRSEP